MLPNPSFLSASMALSRLPTGPVKAILIGRFFMGSNIADLHQMYLFIYYLPDGNVGWLPFFQVTKVPVAACLAIKSLSSPICRTPVLDAHDTMTKEINRMKHCRDIIIYS
jgi:hypothetical protein